jgi:hypothetical protein
VAGRSGSSLSYGCDFYSYSSLNEILGNNPVYGHDPASGVQAAKETFPCAWVNYLVTKVEEEKKAALENANGMQSIGAFDDHPCREKVYGSYCLWHLSLLVAVEEITIVRENGFDLNGKSDMNLQESENENEKFVAVVLFQIPFSRPCQNSRASSS